VTLDGRRYIVASVWLFDGCAPRGVVAA